MPRVRWPGSAPAAPWRRAAFSFWPAAIPAGNSPPPALPGSTSPDRCPPLWRMRRSPVAAAGDGRTECPNAGMRLRTADPAALPSCTNRWLDRGPRSSRRRGPDRHRPPVSPRHGRHPRSASTCRLRCRSCGRASP